MLTLNITPAFNDTDALGHINNASIVTWFENARRPIFEWFVPSLDPKDWCLIIAKLEVEYLAQTTYKDGVEIKTSVEKLGNSSFTLRHDAFQKNTKVATGSVVMVHFDYKAQKSQPIPSDIREKLQNLIS